MIPGILDEMAAALLLAARPPEPVSEPASEPTSEPVSEPMSEPPPSEPVSEPPSEPPSEPVSEPESEPPSEPASEPPSEPPSEPASEPPSEPPAITPIYLGALSGSGSVDPINFGSFDVPADGRMVVGFSRNGSLARSVVNVIIDGVNADLDVVNGNPEDMICVIASRQVTAGSRSVVVDMSSSTGAASTHVVRAWLLPGAAGLHDSGSSGGETNLPRSATMTIPAGGVGIYIHRREAGAVLQWSSAGDPGFTQQGDNSVSAGASLVASSELVDHVETISLESGITSGKLAGASYAPAE